MSHPNQHLAPAFAEIDARRDTDNLVVYWTPGAQERTFDPGFSRDVSWDVDLLEGYAHEVLAGSTQARTRQLISRLETVRPDVLLIPGWGWTINRVALAWATIRRVPFVLLCDSTWQHQFAKNSGVVVARRAILWSIFKLSAGALTTGTFNREFYLAHGMDPAKLIPACAPVDTARYQRPLRTAEDGRHLKVVYAGKVTDSKGVDVLVTALQNLQDMTNWSAVIAGDGEALPELKLKIQRCGLSARVELLGFVNQSAMPDLLGSADIVVVPSRSDFRVLVVTEAMAAGAAVVVSDATAVWGPGDLVEPGRTGLVFPSGRANELAAQLRLLFDDEPTRLRLAREGQRRALEGQSPAIFADSFAAAVNRFA